MSALTTPVTLLSAVVATGASKSVQADAGQPAFLQVSGITTATVAFQGSLDGTTFKHSSVSCRKKTRICCYE